MKHNQECRNQGLIQNFREEGSFLRLSASVRKHALVGGGGGWGHALRKFLKMALSETHFGGFQVLLRQIPVIYLENK